MGPRDASAGRGPRRGFGQARAAGAVAVDVKNPAGHSQLDLQITSVAPRAMDVERSQERLLQAARVGDFRMTVDMIAQGCDIHCCAERGLSPLMLAATAVGDGAVPTLKFLLETKGKVEARDHQGWSAVLHACRSGRVESVNLLQEHRASLAACALDGKTALILAVMEGAEELAKSLMGWKVAVDECDGSGWSPLFYACRKGNGALVSSLLHRGASPTKTSVDGETSLMLAARCGNPKVVKRLLRENVDVNAQERIGSMSALMFALEAHEESIAELLFENSADILAHNVDEDDSIDIAESMGLLALKQKMMIAAVKLQEVKQIAKPKGHHDKRRDGVCQPTGSSNADPAKTGALAHATAGAPGDASGGETAD